MIAGLADTHLNQSAACRFNIPRLAKQQAVRPVQAEAAECGEGVCKFEQPDLTIPERETESVVVGGVIKRGDADLAQRTLERFGASGEL